MRFHVTVTCGRLFESESSMQVEDDKPGSLYLLEALLLQPLCPEAP